MAPGSRRDIERSLPRLRQDVKLSRRFAAHAVTRAQRAADEAAAMRRLLASRAAQASSGSAPARQIWDAAAHELVRISRERDRDLAIVAHELRQPLAAAIAAQALLDVDRDETVHER